jgi:hypothetical protein
MLYQRAARRQWRPFCLGSSFNPEEHFGCPERLSRPLHLVGNNEGACFRKGKMAG